MPRRGPRKRGRALPAGFRWARGAFRPGRRQAASAVQKAYSRETDEKRSVSTAPGGTSLLLLIR